MSQMVSFASNPGGLTLSNRKLSRLHPNLYGFWGNIFGVVFRRTMAKQLMNGDARAAVVLSVSPLLVAAYSDELDASIVLQYPEWLANECKLVDGTQLITVNFYFDFSKDYGDIVPGPRNARRWTGFDPYIGEFLSDDMQRLAELKQYISDDEWRRTVIAGQEYLAKNHGKTRDGRPMHSNSGCRPIRKNWP